MMPATIPLRTPKHAKPRPAEYHDPEHASSRESVARHERRYKVAIRLLHAAHLPNGTILDCACGSGYGTAMLARSFKGRPVVGVDRNVEALRIARERYHAGVDFYCLSIRQAGGWLPGLRPIAGIACLETLEHLNAEQQRLWIGRAYDALEGGGMLVVTCPVRQGQGRPVNLWHLHEPTMRELTDLMADTGGDFKAYPPERYLSTAVEEAWQATATLRRA